MIGRAARLSYGLAGLVGVLAGVIVVLASAPPLCSDGVLTVAVSPEKADLIADLAVGFNTSRPTSCRIKVVNESSGLVADRVIGSGSKAAPQVWLPSATTWVRKVERELDTGSSPIFESARPSLVATPLVIAFPGQYAKDLGTEMSWSSLLAGTRDEKFWDVRPGGRNGPLVVDRTEATYSTSGWNSLALMFAGATAEPAAGGDLQLTAADLESGQPAFEKRLAEIRGVETSEGAMVAHTGEYMTSGFTGEARAIAVEEVTVFENNRRQALNHGASPDRSLAAYYPTDGTLYSDNPFVMRADLDEDLRTTAVGFRRFLLGDDQARDQFAEAGFRDPADHTMRPETAAAAGLRPEPPQVVRDPRIQEMVRVQEIWRMQLHRSVNLLIAVDTSGSMRCPADDRCDSDSPPAQCAPGPSRCRIDVAREAVLGAVGTLGYDDSVGLWEFSTMEGGSTYRKLVEIGRRSPEHLRDVQAAVAGLGTHAHTPLYTTIEAAREDVSAYADQASRNADGSTALSAVVVLSDGVDDPTGAPEDGATAADRLGEFIATLEEPANPVPVYTLRLGKEMEDAKNTQLKNTLEQIATATGGVFRDAADVGSLGILLDGLLYDRLQRR